ncbi:hypothetical protein [Flexivirga oryzae]|uniref:Uncharacterized protein n=1 Tax=Flexivirga oryzae TaxID=1794944 RepID=A0A839N5B5_9MICO|nr:hypothetical protein [Flexivirga oryzae]MBB2891949.1 hypothetical protein [Flexivirga oryzae]
MTEFMTRVAAELATPTHDIALHVRAVESRSTGHGADRLVELRSLGEQLVCEANAVLAESGRSIDLVDETGSNQLAFTLRLGQCWARIVTSFDKGVSWGHLVTPDSVGPDYELADETALGDLILSLVTAGEIRFELSGEPA